MWGEWGDRTGLCAPTKLLIGLCDLCSTPLGTF